MALTTCANLQTIQRQQFGYARRQILAQKILSDFRTAEDLLEKVIVGVGYTWHQADETPGIATSMPRSIDVCTWVTTSARI